MVSFICLSELDDLRTSLTAPETARGQPLEGLIHVLVVVMTLLGMINVHWMVVPGIAALAVSMYIGLGVTGAIAASVTLFALGAAGRPRIHAMFAGTTVVWYAGMVGMDRIYGESLWAFALLLILSGALGAVIGDFRRRHDADLASLAREAGEARARERRLLARELHDVVAHELTIITMQSHVMETARDPQVIEAARQSITATSASALGELKRLLAVMNDTAALVTTEEGTAAGTGTALSATGTTAGDGSSGRAGARARPEEPAAPLAPVERGRQRAGRTSPDAGPAGAEETAGAQPQPAPGQPADEGGLAALTGQLAARLGAVGFTVHRHLDLSAGEPLPRSVEFAASRILREASTDALKYGDPAIPVELTVEVRDDWLVIEVTNGLPREAREIVSQTGHGLIGLTERVRLLGGHLAVTSQDERWQLQVRIPLSVSGARAGDTGRE